MKYLLLISAMFAFATIYITPDSFSFDNYHSRLQFSAMHFGISHVEGNFKTFNVTMTASNEDFSDAKVDMVAEVKSINTDVDKRDEDLRSDKWFDATKFPKITFNSTSFKKLSGNKYKLDGNITIHGVTKPLSLNAVFNGRVLNPMTKKYSVGFTVSGMLKREDFGVGTDAFASVVSNEIEVKSDVELVVNK